jgi:hypothetical protein
MRDIAEVEHMLCNVLGKRAARAFSENMDELTCFVKSLALNDANTTEKEMRSALRKYAEGIIAASVKCYLDEHYMDDFGAIEININDNGIYDRNMQPIRALESIHLRQKEVMALIIAREMYEFTKGRHLAKIIEARSSARVKVMMPGKAQTREMIEVEIMRLERRLPNLPPEDGEKLKKLYARLKPE